MGPGQIATTDYHTAGEPFRIVTSGVPDIPGGSVPERRTFAQSSAEVDCVRQLLCNEPRGHADMYGCFLVPPDDDGADLGVLFWHKDGYSTACGHGTIALGAWAVESGRVDADPDGVTEVKVDVPSGRVVAAVRCARRRGRVGRVPQRPRLCDRDGVAVRWTTTAASAVDVRRYGGAIYASVAARDLGLAVAPEHYSELIAAGRAVKRALEGTDVARHPSDDRLSGIYGTILYDDLGDTDARPAPAQRHGVRRRRGRPLAMRVGNVGAGGAAGRGGRLDGDRVLVHDSIVDTRFEARVVDRVTAEGRDAVVTEVVGQAFRTGDAPVRARSARPGRHRLRAAVSDAAVGRRRRAADGGGGRRARGGAGRGLRPGGRRRRAVGGGRLPADAVGRGRVRGREGGERRARERRRAGCRSSRACSCCGTRRR